MYAATVTVTEVGPNEIEIEIVELDCGTADIATVNGAPILGTVVRVGSELMSGAGTTVDPIATRTTPPASANVGDVVVVPVSTPIATLDIVGSAVFSLTEGDGAGLGRFYHSARCDAGADNIVRTVYRIRVGSW